VPQVIKAKNAIAQEAIQYGPLIPFDFSLITLTANQTTVTVAAQQSSLVAFKVMGLSIVMLTVAGSAAVAVNLCCGTAAEGGLGPTDPLFTTGYPPTAAQMMGNGNILWATDQQLNGTSAPVAGTVYNLYPVSDMWDAIWPNNLALTLRVSTGAAQTGTLQATAFVSLVDIHPDMPNAFNPFAPTNAIL